MVLIGKTSVQAKVWHLEHLLRLGSQGIHSDTHFHRMETTGKHCWNLSWRRTELNVLLGKTSCKIN